MTPGDDLPKIVMPPKKSERNKASSAKPQPVIENPGEVGAKMFNAIVARLKADGHNMILVTAKMRIETRAMVKDKKLFGDDEERESLLIFEAELEREA